MAKRHSSRIDDISSVVERLQELVMAHSGEDTFEEIFKMLIGKIYLEAEPEPSQAERMSKDTADELLAEFNRTLGRAQRKWPGILGDEMESRLEATHLAECLSVLSSVKLTGSDMDVLDHAFEYLVSHASKGAKGQYFTPRHVVECCIQMIDPKPGELILDPACGSGGFLFHALNHVRHAAKGNISDSDISSNLWGVDFDLRASKVAKALMILAGADNAHIYRINSLIKKRKQAALPGMFDAGSTLTLEDAFSVSLPHFKGFDVIVTNPPFAGEITEQETLETYDVAVGAKRVERDVLFIERCVELLRPGGRMAMVV